MYPPMTLCYEVTHILSERGLFTYKCVSLHVKQVYWACLSPLLQACSFFFLVGG